MREDCIHFQTRSYDDGETARFCTLDLAPEAPWRCPAECSGYERLLMAGDFERGSLTRRPVPPVPDADPDAIAAVLDEAEDIVNAAAPAVLAELGAVRAPWWRRALRRRGPDDQPPGLSQR